MVRSPDGDDENRTTAVFVRAERPSLIPRGPATDRGEAAPSSDACVSASSRAAGFATDAEHIHRHSLFQRSRSIAPGPVSLLRSFPPDIRFVFVNDGSSDATLSKLEELVASPPDRTRIIDQQPHRGKAAAVRVGILSSFASGAEYVGYWDADLAAPLNEIERMQRLLEERPACQTVFGARGALLGRRIERSALRHYLGRIFANSASLTLRLKVYDTQTGAKLFRNCESTRSLCAKRFLTTWIFDVEIPARFVTHPSYLERPSGQSSEYDPIVELPLREWGDRARSKVKPISFVISFFEMAKLYRHYFGRRKGR